MVKRSYWWTLTALSFFGWVLLATSNGYGRVQYSVNATAGVLFDFNTGQFLVEQNADQPISPASFTKVMTLYGAQEAIEKGMIIPGPFFETIDEKTGEVLSDNPFEELMDE